MARVLGCRLVKASLLLLSFLACVACTTRGASPLLPKATMPPAKTALPLQLDPPGLPAIIVAELASPEQEVRFARNRNRALVASRTNGKWLVGPVRVDRDDDSALAPVDGHSGMRPLCDAPENTPATLRSYREGFVLAWVDHPRAGAEQIWALGLDADGQAIGEPHLVGHSAHRIDWLDVIAQGDSAFVVWDGHHGPKREVRVASWREAGASEPVGVAAGRAWHAVVANDALMFGSVGDDTGDTGRVTLDRITPKNGKLAVDHVTVSGSATALGDVQLAVVDGRVLFAWTDRQGGDLQVFTAWVAPDLTASSPRAIDPVGGHGLVSLLASGDGKRALVAWERERSATGDGRTIELATLSHDGSLGDARAELVFHASADTPQLFGDGPGFGALTLAPLAVPGSDAAQAVPAPYYARLDARLAVLAAEPIRVAGLVSETEAQGVPLVVHTPDCVDGLCTVVARGGRNPSLLALVKLPVRRSSFAAPVHQRPAPEPPLAERLRTIAEIDAPLAGLDAAELSDGRTLVAWLTHAPGEPGEPAPANAKLQLRFVEKDGALTDIITLSDKAISIGGVDVEAQEGSDAVAAIGWAGSHQGAQLFVTKIGAKGEKLQQKAVTKLARNRAPVPKGKQRVASELFDIDIASDGKGGLVCAYSDTRDGDAEIYLARIDQRLERRGNEVRVTNAKGTSSEPVLAVIGDRALVAWSETRDGRNQGELYLASLDLGRMRLVGQPRELDQSPGHARTPGFAAAPGGLALWWLEEPARNEEPESGEALSFASTPGARLLALDGSGQPLAQIRTIGGSDTASSASFRCDSDGCRGVIAGPEGGELRLSAVRGAFASGAPPSRKPLASLPGGTLEDVRLVAGAGHKRVWFAQQRNGRSRVRELSLRW